MKLFATLFLLATTGATAMELNDVQSLDAYGVPLILRSTPSYGDIVSIEITAKGGVSLASKAGTLDLLIRTLSAGTPSYSKEDIDRIFSSTGTQFGVDARADYIELSIKCLKRFLPTILPVVIEMITKPNLEPKEIDITRAQAMADLKNEQEHPDAILQLESHKAFFAHHPYLQRSNGYLETISSITRDDMVQTLPLIFNKKNVTLFVIGLFDASEAKEIGEQLVATLPEDKPAGTIPSQAISPSTQDMTFKKFSAPTTYFMARFKAPALRDLDYPALTLASQILDNRLFEEVRTKRALTYSVHTSLSNNNVNSGYLYVSSTKLNEAVKVIFDEVKKIQTELVPSDQLALEVRKFTSNWWLSREASSSQTRIFALYEMIGPGWQSSNGFIERLARVTPEALRSAAQKYFKGYTVTVVGPEKPDLKNLIPKS